MHPYPAAPRDLESERLYAETTIGVPELDGFVDQGLITRVHAQLTSGKEGTVFCCRAHPSTRRRFIAAKVYRQHAESSYKLGATYFDGRERDLKMRTVRAIRNRTSYGKAIAGGMWIEAEYSSLCRLVAAGASTPVPIALSEHAILMEYIGNGAGPAPHLNGVELDPAEARCAYDQVMGNVVLMLHHHLVHGDLSPYNILFWKGNVRIIDLPQAVDARFNHAAPELLRRDIENVCGFFAQHGIDAQPTELALDLWDRYQRARL
ncbi:RIO1 family regulatory kinase/ATPase [Candidatus Bipolaricaulota bacterium]